MDRQPRYGVGDLLYIVARLRRYSKKGLSYSIEVEKIVKIEYYKNLDIFYYRTEYCTFAEHLINTMDFIISAFDTREQAYQAACKLINDDIERQLDVIRKSEKE